MNKDFGILGLKNELKKISINENISTNEKIERYLNTDIKARNAIIELYEKGVNEHQIINLLALGNFGININKKLVPTKWAITTFDQCIEKYLFSKINLFRPIIQYELYNFKDKGNHFVVILFPKNFIGEIIESFPGAIEKDYINFENKLDKQIPSTAGGYYATKLGIYEYFRERKKFSAFISIRVINDYEIPLGVIFVREAIRQVMKNQSVSFSNQLELEIFLKENFLEHYFLYKNSKIVKELNTKKLTDF